MDSNETKPWKDLFASYLKEPTLPNLRKVLRYEAIEDDDVEFKAILVHEAEIAQHILAMANTRGGVIIFGLKEIKKESRFEPIGIDPTIETTSLWDKLDRYLPSELRELTRIIPQSYEESEYGKLKDKVFLSIIVNFDARYIPFLPRKASGDTLKKTIVYVRKNYSSRAAEYDDLQNIFKNRIETEYTIASSKRKLREHLEELKELYTHIPKTIGAFSLDNLAYGLSKNNPNYPKESFEAFVNRMIETKKSIIEKLTKE